jgi:hypothetical protein
MGGIIYNSFGIIISKKPTIFSVTLGARIKQNLYTTEFATMAIVLK